ncbi:MAG TPA: M56 family metallopeptidase [Flavisolibacter sp.]|nr:M56 family metallopeptidase [Flavisolibacter sp.]
MEEYLFDFVAAFSGTLLHSLWMGVLFAALAGLYLFLAGKSRAKARYTVLLAFVCLFLISLVITFFYLFTKQQELRPVTVRTMADVQAIARTLSSADPVSSFINLASPYVFAAWLLLFCIRMIFFFRSALGINKLRRSSSSIDLAGWNEKLSSFKALLRVSRLVEIRESAAVRMPLLIGYLKPVILFPIGFVNRLKPEEVEVIVLHELYHIRRHDYLVNLLQTICENILFFNPAFLWLSGQVKEEREGCCDELVLQKLGHRQTYIDALVASYEFSLASSSLSLGFAAGRSHQLLQRVQRMVSGQSRPPGRSVVLLLLSGLLITACSFFGISKAARTSAAHKPVPVHYHGKTPCSETACGKLRDVPLSDSLQRVAALVQVDDAITDGRVKEMVRHMLREKVIVSIDGLEFRLDREKLSVNGKEQPDCIRQMLQDEFLDPGTDRIVYKQPK